MPWESLWKLLPTYDHMTWQLIVLYVIAGTLGALVRAGWLDKPLRGFYRDENGGIRMGFYAEILVAVAVAIAVDGHPIRAGIAAIFAPTILDAIKTLITTTIPEVLKIWLLSKINKTKK